MVLQWRTNWTITSRITFDPLSTPTTMSLSTSGFLSHILIGADSLIDELVQFARMSASRIYNQRLANGFNTLSASSHALTYPYTRFYSC